MALAQDGHGWPNVGPSRSKYLAPNDVKRVPLDELLSAAAAWKGRHQSTLNFGDKRGRREAIYYAGDLSLLAQPCISVVGTRKATPEGAVFRRAILTP